MNKKLIQKKNWFSKDYGKGLMSMNAKDFNKAAKKYVNEYYSNNGFFEDDKLTEDLRGEVVLKFSTRAYTLYFKFSDFSLEEFIKFLNEHSEQICIYRKKFYSRKFVLENFTIPNYKVDYNSVYYSDDFCTVYYHNKSEWENYIKASIGKVKNPGYQTLSNKIP